MLGPFSKIKSPVLLDKGEGLARWTKPIGTEREKDEPTTQDLKFGGGPY